MSHGAGMDFCFGSAENTPWSVCQNILLSVLNALSSLQVEYRSVSCIIFLLCFLSAITAHTHRHSTSLCLRFQSPSPHKQASLSFAPTYSISVG